MLGVLLAGAGAASAGEEPDWVAFNPAMKGATSVGNTTQCAECHDDYLKAFANTKHARVYKATAGKGIGASCEVCHGPASKHLEEKDESKKAESIISFKRLTPQQKSQVCLQCHEKGQRLSWRGSPHEMNNISCDKCHYVMARKSKQSFTIFEDSKKVCFMCHKDKRARMNRSAHMPLREGKMSCSDCHNPHGGPGPSQLKTATVNETCYNCHQEKRGPMVWEHAPVRENCSNCHDPHGTNQVSMLKQKMPYLCQTCHMAAQHPSALYEGNNLPGRSATAQRDLLGKACLNCHSRIHGSSHPSGARFLR
jgi:DmsE family decaheme c-type cytochrome